MVKIILISKEYDRSEFPIIYFFNIFVKIYFMRKPYQKHFVIINKSEIKVKDWMRQNTKYFKNIKGVPTSNQIGVILSQLGFNKTDYPDRIVWSVRV